MDSITTYNLGATETGFTNVQTDASTSQALEESGIPNLRMAVSNKLTLPAGAVDTREVLDLEFMVSSMKLGYDFDGTSVLVKSVARKLIKGYSGRLKESAIREAALEYAELFDSVCKDSENSWLKR